jgi:hypothetical protein
VAKEQFGPALPVIPYNSEAEAVALADQTWSGRQGLHEFTETHVLAVPSEARDASVRPWPVAVPASDATAVTATVIGCRCTPDSGNFDPR